MSAKRINPRELSVEKYYEEICIRCNLAKIHDLPFSREVEIFGKTYRVKTDYDMECGACFRMINSLREEGKPYYLTILVY